MRTLEVFHADSLGGPMLELKRAFEAKNAGIVVNLVSGTSRALADRILEGESCDVFAPSSPKIAAELIEKGTAAWSVIFSANEIVVITARGNPHNIAKVADLAAPGIRFARIPGENDLGTGRSVEFLNRAAKLENAPDAARKILDKAPADPAKPNSVPMTVRAVSGGEADAGVVYYSAAIAAQDKIEIIRFPASVNLSEAIRNAATVPVTAKRPKEATAFVAFLLSTEGREILALAGQPPVVPAIRNGRLPPELAG